MGKTKKQTKTLWTTPANPNLRLFGKRKRADELTEKEREQELQERLKPFEAVLDSKTLSMLTGYPQTL